MSSFYPVPGSPEAQFSGRVLVLPSVSLANLPQLAVDLLITSLGLSRVGCIGRGDTVVPFVGAGEEQDEVVTGGLEVYGKEGSEIFVIQQRSPTIKSRKEAHIELLRDFIASSGFAFTLILTSLDAANQDDAQLLTPHQRILPLSSPSTPYTQRLEHLLPPLQLHLSSPSTPLSSNSSSPYPPFLPAAGLTRRLLTSLAASAPNTSHGAVTAWCVEGDNRDDARALAETALAALGIDGLTLRQPRSWKGLFGASEGWSGGMGSNAELYG